jgi:glycosyltransferase involved in cell wall biosynthesis
MKVLYFHQHFTTPKGASGTRSYEFARELLARGHDVTMVCGSYKAGATGLDGVFKRGRREGQVDGINVVEFELPYSNADGFVKRSSTFLKFALRSGWLALTERYDLIFTTSTPLTAAIPGILAAYLRRKPFVFEVRDLWPELPRAMGVISNPVVLWCLGILEKMAYRAADHVIGLAPGIIQGIKQKSRENLRTTLIPNGCDLNLFDSGSEPGQTIAGTSEGDFTAVFTGAHGIANGLDAVLDAAAELQKRGRDDIKLVFIGDGMKKAQLVERAENQTLSNCVFIDPMPKIELTGLVQKADVGLMILANVEAFYYGTSPNKFFDYIAAGKPVVCNYPGWVADMLNEWHAGVAVPADDAKAFADALIDLADDRARLQPMARQARALAEQKFDRRILAATFVDVLESVAEDETNI